MAAVLKTASTSLGVTSAPAGKNSCCQSMAEAALIGMNVQQASAAVHASTFTVASAVHAQRVLPSRKTCLLALVSF